MKKITITITTLGLIALVSCGLVFYLSCKKEVDCSGCYLTNEQLAFICYTSGQKIIFKNDSTNIFDTLRVGATNYGTSTCASPCDKQNGWGEQWFQNTYLMWSILNISSSGTPSIEFGSNIARFEFEFPLSVSAQTVTINSKIYNDVYSAQIDSTTIKAPSDKQEVPWKIYYSKSKGFVRFYMANGQTWSKL